MKHPIAFLIPIVFTGLFCLSLLPVPKTPGLINAEFETFFADILKNPQAKRENQTIAKIDSTAVSNKQLVKLKNVLIPRHTIEAKTAALNQLNSFPYDRLTACNKFRNLNLRSKLTDQINVLEHNDIKSGEASDLSDRAVRKLVQQRRYMNKIRGYSGSELSIDELIKYGQSEAKIALAGLSRLEKDIVSAGLATSLDDFQAQYVKSYSSEAEIIEAFNSRNPILERNLPKFFHSYDLPTPRVAASRRLNFAYAIGTYSTRRNTFYFYWDGESFLEKDLDYLMIHELVPGHHLQLKLANSISPCSVHEGIPPIPQSRYTRSFMEGWATYIEPLGFELGLFQTFEQKLGYWDWQLIRSHRVILDARLHHDNWSWEQFEDYWNENLPVRLRNLAEREYKRLRKMPLQTQSYKFGADAFTALRKSEEARLGNNFDIRDFHDKILRMPPVPMEILEDAYAVLP